MAPPKASAWPPSILVDPEVLSLDDQGRFVNCRVCAESYACFGGKKPRPVRLNARFRPAAWETHKLRTRAHRLAPIDPPESIEQVLAFVNGNSSKPASRRSPRLELRHWASEPHERPQHRPQLRPSLELRCRFCSRESQDTHAPMQVRASWLCVHCWFSSLIRVSWFMTESSSVAIIRIPYTQPAQPGTRG